MLIGYVSDHRYIALSGVEVEILHKDFVSIATHSRASGAVHADLPPGDYEIVLAKDGYGSKRVRLSLPTKEPHQFRLLADGLLGYAWPKWVKSGEAAEFRVHSDAAYKLELWRYGWKKELVRPIGWFDEHGPRATVQIVPDGDYTQTGVMWNKFGYASPHHKQYCIAPERSGLYYFHAKNENGIFFSFPWIVAPAKPTAPIAVLASNITWNAYNNFGGRSNYIHPDKLPPSPTANARLELGRYIDPTHVNYGISDYLPLSFDRPEPVCFIPENVQVTDPIAGRAACHLAPAEWRFLGWLEREKIAYDYYAETQLHFGQLDLDAYKILITTTHPEYWSSEMYYKVKQWVFERSGKLMYLGGNGLNSDVEFLDGQTCIIRNEDERRLKPSASPTGKGISEDSPYESRFHVRAESEANLLGVVYDDRAIMTAAPYKVIDAPHWVFQGTGLKNGDTFGHASLHERIPGGASGHETDKRSPSSPPGTHLLAKGTNKDNGGGEMVVFDTKSRGSVFSVGSITWPASILVDDAVSRITGNVVRRFLET